MFPAAKLPSRVGPYRVHARARVERGAELLLAREDGPLGYSRDVTLRSIARDADGPMELELAREARICERLDHPAIARVVDVFADGDRMILAVEGWETVTLAEILAQEGALPDTASAYVLATVASALACAHASGVVHRAVTASAIAIGSDGSARLSGFAAARLLETTIDSAAALLDGRERMRSPEEAGGAVATAKGDVWALGVLALRLFSGADGETVAARAGALRPPRLGALRRDLPREVCAAIDAALALDPARRTITCAEIARWLTRVMDVRAGRRELAERVEPEHELPSELLTVPRRSRTIRRQAASRRRLRRTQPTDALEVEELELEPISDTEIEEDVADEALSDEEPTTAEPLVLHPVALFAPKVATSVAPARRRRSLGLVRFVTRSALVAMFVAAFMVLTHRAAPKFQPSAAGQQVAEPTEQETESDACLRDPAHCAVVPAPPPVIVPPAHKLPPEFGWAHVHSGGTTGQVFVAARAWGEPEKTIAVPCGHLYVNVARADSKGNWHGWLNIGRTIDIPCDGTVAEVTLPRPSATSSAR